MSVGKSDGKSDATSSTSASSTTTIQQNQQTPAVELDHRPGLVLATTTVQQITTSTSQRLVDNKQSSACSSSGSYCLDVVDPPGGTRPVQLRRGEDKVDESVGDSVIHDDPRPTIPTTSNSPKPMSPMLLYRETPLRRPVWGVLSDDALYGAARVGVATTTTDVAPYPRARRHLSPGGGGGPAPPPRGGFRVLRAAVEQLVEEGVPSTRIRAEVEKVLRETECGG